MSDTILCDIDGVLRNLISGICSVAGKEYTQEIHDSITKWDTDLFGKPIPEWAKNPEVFQLAPPYNGAHKFVRGMSSKFPFYYLTCQNKNPEILKATYNWLANWGFIKKGNGVLVVYQHKHKAEIQQATGWWLIDDHPELTELFYKDECKFIGFRRPWNSKGWAEDYDQIAEYIESYYE